MAGDLRSALRAGARSGTGRTLPIAVLLGVIVVIAAGIGGTADFTGDRWFPNLHSKVTPGPPLTVVTPTTITGGLRPPVNHHGAALPDWIVVTAIVLVVGGLLALFLHFWRGRRLPPGPTLPGTTVQATQQLVEVEPEPEPEQLLTGIELALRALDEEREPADAVVRAWLGLQETAEESGIVRGAAETPTEFTSRILGRAFTDDAAVRTLLRLYLRTRFGDHPVTAQDVTEVRAALQRLVSNWKPAADAAAKGRS